MAQNIARAKRSEKGLLTPDNCVVAIIDLQPQMLFGVANFDRQTIINNNVALSKAARVFDVPVVSQHGGDQEFQRLHVAADPGGLPESDADRALVDELLGRQELRGGHREERQARRSSCPGFGRRPASRCRPCRRFTTTTRSTSSRTAAAT